MFFAVFVEAGDTLDCHVIRLCRTRGENDILGVSPDEVRDMLGSQGELSRRCDQYSNYLAGILNALLRLPTVGMSPAVRVSVLVSHVWKHGVEYARVNWCCCLRGKERERSLPWAWA